jgi:hypothetical protein
MLEAVPSKASYPTASLCVASSLPRVTFGIIVLNGEPFTRYCLRALYPFAHQIIVVEGAVRAAAETATADGHSTDGTLESLYRFKREDDTEGKLEIVTGAGFWSEKDEQSQAYAARANGEYLWQIDIDEFYQPADMLAVLQTLRDDPEISGSSFKQITFWGGFDYITDGWYLRRGAALYSRLFRWKPGHRYVTHRPPTVFDRAGNDLRKLRWLDGNVLASRGIYLYHYSLVFPKQVREKCNYYSVAEWAKEVRASREWVEQNFLRLQKPFHVHNVYGYPSWLERFSRKHPPIIEELISDIEAGRVQIGLRQNSDIEELLRSSKYRLARCMLKTVGVADTYGYAVAHAVAKFAKRKLKTHRE